MLAPLPAFREGGRFLRLICIASVFKAACGVAGGATGAAITEHWAIDNNIADIGAKVECGKSGNGLWFVASVHATDSFDATLKRRWQESTGELGRKGTGLTDIDKIEGEWDENVSYLRSDSTLSRFCPAADSSSRLHATDARKSSGR